MQSGNVAWPESTVGQTQWLVCGGSGVKGQHDYLGGVLVMVDLVHGNRTIIIHGNGTITAPVISVFKRQREHAILSSSVYTMHARSCFQSHNYKCRLHVIVVTLFSRNIREHGSTAGCNIAANSCTQKRVITSGPWDSTPGRSEQGRVSSRWKMVSTVGS